MSVSDIDEALRIARELRPDLWERTEAVARIIDPAAFAGGWTIVEPASAARLHEARVAYQRSNAMLRAQEILAYLGVNTETDWFTILTRLAERSASPLIDRDGE
jgi:hypothetical protein